MRNRRLLTLAVLAVAIGFPAYAQAADPYYGTAVVTLIQRDAVEGIGTFDVNVRLWDDAGIGEDASASTAGLIDFSIASITGGTSGAVVETLAVTAPLGEVTDGGTIFYDAGFTLELIKSSGGVFNVTSVQPVMYNGTGTNDPLRDAAILIGVGTTGYEVGGDPQDVAGQWSVEPAAYAGDTPILSGTYSGDGILGVITFGTMSFSSMGTAAPFDGPTPDPGTTTTVKAVVIQTITGADAAGNDGGAAELTGVVTVRMKVEVGDIVLGELYAGGQNVTLQVSEPDTSVTMAADRTFGGTDNPVTLVPGGLDIRKDNDGYQVVDVADVRIDVYTPDPAQTQLNIQGMLGDASDGLYSSAIDPGNPNHILVVTPEAGDHVAIKATLYGDADLSGKVDDGDYALMLGSWFQEGKYWTDGDIDGSGKVDDGDYALMLGNWFQTFVPFTPAPGAVPEPATLSLLALGLLGVMRRRRK